MRREFLKSNNKQFEIIEDDRNHQDTEKQETKPKLHRYYGQLDKLSKATKETLTK